MYYGDHPPPHFHARYGGDSAKIEIAGGEVIAGSLLAAGFGSCENGARSIAPSPRATGDDGTSNAPSKAPSARSASMKEIIHVTDVVPLEGLWIRVTFTDGAVKEIDLSELLATGGVFAPIYEQREIFEQVAVNPESGTVEWPGQVDLDPEVLYGRDEPVAGHPSSAGPFKSR
jgi:hypothetical protein